jgi:Fe-S-cluster containining protein
MEKLDFHKHCVACGIWCCRGEYPFKTPKMLKELNIDKIGQNPDNSCIFLSENKCVVYSKRPFECRMYPFDICKIEEKYIWILWDACPATKVANLEENFDNFEKNLLNNYSKEFIQDYVRYHEKTKNKKYDNIKFKIIKEVNFQSEQKNT